MSYEILVGLEVLDDDKYEDYRAAMKPILSSYQGGFGYDFKVSEVLIAPEDKRINRVFTISFASKKLMEDFFSDADYLIVKAQHFVDSVGCTTIIANYEK